MTHLLLGLILILFGFFHLIDEIAQYEESIVQKIQQIMNRKPFLSLFREIWLFGRTSFTVIFMVFLILIDWKVGILASGVFLVIVGIEYLLKTFYNRKRPFLVHQKISMLQPIEPLDSSFPSGDVLRVWYLVFILPALSNISPFVLGAAISLAVLVSLGRIVMGVHYLTDTFAGAGLGIIGAGTTIWLSNILNIV